MNVSLQVPSQVFCLYFLVSGFVLGAFCVKECEYVSVPVYVSYTFPLTHSFSLLAFVLYSLFLFFIIFYFIVFFKGTSLFSNDNDKETV